MKRLVNVLTVVVYLFSLAAISTGEVKAAEATAKVKHKQVKYFVPEHRIIVNAEVSDPNGVNLVRCYFKASAQADYVFVGMQPSSGGDYQGILPAPDKNTQTIEYLFLVLNNKKQVVKTQKFTVAKKDSKDVPSWQNVGSQGNIQVSTEVPTTSETLKGFKDSIAIDLVESSARLGLVAGGIYAAVHVASAGGAAAAATSAGTITASTGMSTSTIAGIGAGVAAVAIIAMSGSDDDPYCSKYKCIYPEPCIEGCGRYVPLPTPPTPQPTCGGDRDANGSDAYFVDTFEMGKKSGTFDFKYNTRSIGDRLKITYLGVGDVQFGDFPNDTCIKTGSNVVNGVEQGREEHATISYSGNSSQFKVEVFPNCEGNTSETKWSFHVGCPQ